MDKSDLLRRRAGVALPLSAIRSGNDAGIGDMSTVAPLMDWMENAGLSILQILPLNDLAPMDSSPYSPISAFAIDPAYAALGDIPDLPQTPAPPKRLHTSARVRFADARAFKLLHLRIAFRRFERQELKQKSPRAKAFQSFCRKHAHWLIDYALFRILKERGHWRSIQHWQEQYRQRDMQAMRKLRETEENAVCFYQYVQWVLQTQWRAVRDGAKARGILLYGDIPFGLSRQSADVWANQDDFDFNATMGAPPDTYSETGQAWGLPAYRWTEMEASGHTWWRRRIARAKEHFDLYRIDHAVGFFRTWLIQRGRAKNGFDISGADTQRQRGQRFFRLIIHEGHPARPIAEDLGLIPSYVPGVLTDLGIPGYKVTRWEKSGTAFKDPRKFPPLSVVTTGNHDTSTLAAWWSEIHAQERDAYWRMVSHKKEAAPRFSPEVLQALLKNIYDAGSAIAIFPFQDLFGARERINIPGTFRNRNWTYRTPMLVEELLEDPPYINRARLLHSLAHDSGRLA